MDFLIIKIFRYTGVCNEKVIKKNCCTVTTNGLVYIFMYEEKRFSHFPVMLFGNKNSNCGGMIAKALVLLRFLKYVLL